MIPAEAFENVVQWCSFCNAAPATGTLNFEETYEDEIGTQQKEIIPLPACVDCALSESAGFDVKGLNA